MLTLAADEARERYQKIYARFGSEPTGLDLSGAQVLRRDGREIELVTDGDAGSVLDRLKAASPEALTSESLTLEEIFVATLQPQGVTA